MAVSSPLNIGVELPFTPINSFLIFTDIDFSQRNKCPFLNVFLYSLWNKTLDNNNNNDWLKRRNMKRYVHAMYCVLAYSLQIMLVILHQYILRHPNFCRLGDTTQWYHQNNDYCLLFLTLDYLINISAALNITGISLWCCNMLSNHIYADVYIYHTSREPWVILLQHSLM